MIIFNSESTLLAALAEIEAELECAARSDADTFRAHYDKAGHLYGYFALDGHESDEEERALLEMHRTRIVRIEAALRSADGLCSEEDAGKELYRKAGRYGAEEAMRRIRSALAQHGFFGIDQDSESQRK
jgi:hypothetical protein